MEKNNINRKIKVRHKYKRLREETIYKKEKLIFKQVLKFITTNYEINNIKLTIGIYWPLEGEVDLRDLKESLNSTLALPACTSKGEISYRKWTMIL